MDRFRSYPGNKNTKKRSLCLIFFHMFHSLLIGLIQGSCLGKVVWQEMNLVFIP